MFTPKKYVDEMKMRELSCNMLSLSFGMISRKDGTTSETPGLWQR